ncbi:MAG: GNAT family N-acetyltransferase [Eubacteriaceae bacterium]
MYKFEIKRANKDDLSGLLKLYTQLHDNTIPQIDSTLLVLWNDILFDRNHYILVGKIGIEIVSSCVLIIIPNLTHQQQPYALIENVITSEKYRNKGYATQLLNFARDIAQKHKCYKIMLLTGSKKEDTLDFYRKAGYNCKDKTAFIQWL